MTLGAALAAAPGIEPRPRDVRRERELMQRLAGIAATFTPQVCIEPPDGLLLEIKPSINLFGGLRQLCRRLREACRADPVFAPIQAQPRFTLAPTALAALASARAGARCFITDPAVALLAPLPLAVLRWPEEENARPHGHGVRTLGELMRLPRAGSPRFE
jgi:protein ImuB